MCTTNKLVEGTKFARQCDECGSGMNEGYVVNGGEEYYCTEECLHKHYSADEWIEMCGDDDDDDNDSDSYWTDWNDDQSDWQFIVNGGVLVDMDVQKFRSPVANETNLTQEGKDICAKCGSVQDYGTMKDKEETSFDIFCEGCISEEVRGEDLSPAELLERALEKMTNNTIGAWEGDLGNTIDAVALEDFHGLEEKPDEITDHYNGWLEDIQKALEMLKKG